MEQITAQQAAQIADQKNAASQMEDIYKSINILAKQGMYQVYSDRLLTPGEVKELERLGYKVEIPNIGKCHKITWDNPATTALITETMDAVPQAGEVANPHGDDDYSLPDHLKYIE
jgi:hypothetical protein